MSGGKSNILVTGGSGFIGTRLTAALLEAGHEVRVYDKRPSSRFPNRCTLGDVRDQESLARACAGIDVVYNLAAEHADNVSPPSLYWDVNVGGAQNLCAAATETGVGRLVFTSSVAVYGLGRTNPDECAAPAPFNEYGRSKLRAEEIFRDWAALSDARSLTIVRPCVIFGPKNRGNVYTLLRQIATRRFVMIGRGRNEKSLGYVDNLVGFLVYCMELSGRVGVYNYADKPDLTTSELVSSASKALGVPQRSFSIPYPIGLAAGYAFDCLAFLLRRRWSISSARVRKFCASTAVSNDAMLATGFSPGVTLVEGLRRTIEFEFGSEAGRSN